MAIDYTKHANESIPQYNARIAAANTNLPAPATVSPTGVPGLGYQAPTPQPIPSPIQQPTMASIYGNDPYSNANQNAASKSAVDFMTNGLDQATQDQIRSSTLASFQAEIDAQNRVFADKLASAKVQGQGRIGQSTAIQARRGLLGSDFGAAQTDTVNTANNEVYGAIGNELAAAIANINSRGKVAVDAALKEKTAAKQGQLDSYVKYLSEGATRSKSGATELAQILLTHNQDTSIVTSEQLDQFGTNKGTLDAIFAEAKKAADEAATQEATEAQKATDLHLKTTSDIQNTSATQQLNEKKFEEDKRQYGLDYALKQQDLRLKQEDIDLKRSQADGFGGYSEKQAKAITAINEKVSKNATYAKTTSMRTFAENVNQSLSLGNGVADIAAINQFQKVIDEGAVTRDQDVKLISGAQSLMNTLKTKISKLEKGDQLSPEQRTQMKTLVDNLYQAQIKALQKDPYIAAKNKEVEAYGLTVNDTILGELGGFGSNAHNTSTGGGASGKTSSGNTFEVVQE